MRCFCHLHLHTHYSLLDGFNRIPPLVAQCKKLNMSACAITDHGNLYGAIEFYNECKKGGIKPIIGYEAYLAPVSRLARDNKHDLGHATHLTLLAKNAVGFKNLIKLSSLAYLEGFYRHPRIDREILEAHSEGLVCLSGCLAGELNQYIVQNKRAEAEKSAKWFRKVFGENYYIEIQNNGISLQDECTPVAADIAQKLGVPLVATADAHYLCSDDAQAHDVLFCINLKKEHDRKKRRYPEERMPNPYYVRSPEDMYRLFPNYEDAVARSQEIADGVDIDIDFKKRHFPVFGPPNELTPDQYLRELCEKGMYERYGAEPSDAVRKRLDHELNTICKMGFASYFLIVWDFVRFAREVGIPSTARGSGCGAMACYVLYISHVCPLEYDLLFERFLDPNRSEAPDIDIDFCQDRRALVIEYVKQKYGEKSVAQIGTFGTLAAKAALKDVGRAFGQPPERMNALCKLVPMKGAISKSLQEALDESPDFKREYDQDPEIHEIVDIALKLEGTNRNVGTHAAGVVIANGPITDYVPVQRPPKQEEGSTADTTTMTTQWEMGILEKVGMLKMDFLGLRNLTVLDNCVKLIKKTRGETVDPMKFPLEDEATYKLLQRGDAKGVFQLESEGIRELLKRMKPDNIRDLIAVLALYRPGPLEGGMVDEYVECKHGRRQPVYPHPIVEEVLKETYGVMCIHEDARVALADGTEKPIKEVRRFDRVHTLNLDTRAIEVRECHGCGPTRRGTGLKLVLENGFAVTLTPDHKVWTWAGWKEIRDLDAESDLVACGLNTPQEHPTADALAPWLGADEDVGYLFGLLTGDGCLTSTGVTVATGTEAAHEKLVAWLEARFPELRVHGYFAGRSWYANLSHPALLNDAAHGNRKTKLHHLLEVHGLKTKATAKRVPVAIFRASAGTRAAYLAGVLDSDGCIATNSKGAGTCFITSASPELLQDLRRLCQLMGVAVKLYPQRLQVWNLKRLRAECGPRLVVKRFPEVCGDGGTVGWVPREEVFASIPAGESVRAFSARTSLQRRGLAHDFPFVKSSTARKAGIDLNDVRFYRLARIETVEDQQFYGMSVAEHHNLLANGVVVKNCYQEQIMRMLNRMGGIELAKAYACIKAISKKNFEIINARKADFVAGAVQREMSEEKANEIFDLIVKFGGYGFNKCVVASTVVTDANTGEAVTVGELFESRRPIRLHALGVDNALRPRAVTDVVWNGRKRVYQLTTELGKSITATANHPFWTPTGWTDLGNLSVGDLVGTADLARREPARTAFFTPKGCDNLARCNAPGHSLAHQQTEGVRHGRASVAPLRGAFDSARAPGALHRAKLSHPFGVTGDVIWDRVVSIEYVGVEDTYDLTVDEDHNFVANGLIVHNSHTAAYAQIGYQTAYLKTHYTAEYMAALLSSEIDDGNKRDVFIDHIADSRRLGIDVLPPDVNRGLADFDVQNNRIIFGLTAIKGLGRGAAEEIVRARNAGGKFKDLFDFAERVDRRVVQKAAVEKMIMAGAFDALGKRAAQFAAVTKAYAAADERASERKRGQTGLFDDTGDDTDTEGGAVQGLPDVPEWPETERLKFEKEALDFYISSHPLAEHEEQLRRFRTHDAGDLAKGGKNGTEARIGGMITNLNVRTANKGRNVGRKYAMFRIEDFTGSVRCIMWSDEYSRFKDLVDSDLVALFEGVLNWAADRAEPDFAVKKVITIDEARTEFSKSMVLKLPYTDDPDVLRKLDAVGGILKRSRGSCPVYLSVRDGNGKQVQMKLGEEFRVNPAAVKLEELEMLLGPGSVVFSR